MGQDIIRALLKKSLDEGLVTRLMNVDLPRAFEGLARQRRAEAEREAAEERAAQRLLSEQQAMAEAQKRRTQYELDWKGSY